MGYHHQEIQCNYICRICTILKKENEALLADFKVQQKLRMQYEVSNAELKGELEFLK